MTDAEKLEQVRAWLHPGLWSAIDARREALMQILDGEQVDPPDWARSTPP